MTKASKNWTKRAVTYYGDRAVEINIAVYDHGKTLTPDELKAAADDFADQAMISMQGNAFIHAPLSRINVKRNAK